MVERGRRFFLKVPPGYVEMTEAEQKAAAVAMWADAMTQLGEDPDKLTRDHADRDERPGDGS